jgi:glycosyltransferase involved in cell wall biosynthesis
VGVDGETHRQAGARQAVPPPERDAGRRLRLVHFTDSIDPSGVGQHIALLARELAALGHAQTLVCPDVPAAQSLMEGCAAIGVEVRPLRVRSERDVQDYTRLVQLLSGSGANGSTSNGRAGRRGFDLFHNHVGITWEGCWGTFAAAEAGVPVICTEHLPYLIEGDGERALKLHAGQYVSHTIAVSHGVGRSLLAHQIVPPHRLRVVWNGIELAAFSPERRPRLRTELLGLAHDTPLALCVARLTPQKGHATLLEALALARRQEPRLTLALAGEGPLRETLRAQAARLGVAGAVRFLGRYGPVARLLSAADVLVQPSLFEGLPLSVLEGMACALPVVVADVVGGNETVVQGESGLVVPPDDPPALAETLLRVVGDEALAARLGANARRRAEREFDAPVMAQRTLSVYAEAVRGRGRVLRAVQAA